MEAAELPTSLPLDPLPAERLLLGTMLVQRGLLTLEQLEAALVEREQSNRRLGEILVARGLVSRDDLARALAEQHGLDYLDLARTEIDVAAARLLPEKFSHRYGALPVQLLDENLVLVAVADPTNVLASDDLRLALGLNVRLAVVSSDELEAAIARLNEPDAPVRIESARVRHIDDLDDGAPASPAVQLVNSVITHALQERASDVHFEPQANEVVVRIRVDGVMRTLTTIDAELQAAVTSRLKVMGELDIADRRTPQDGRINARLAGQEMDLRVAVLPTTHGEQVVLRILNRANERMTVSDLGMSPDTEEAFVRSIHQPYGVVIACGPTGSGKTTTLYAGTDILNDVERCIMTVEDPVEYQIPGINQVEVNTKSGLTFARGLRTILRSDPDVLLVGEIRDEETARIAVQAGMTGHLVLTSLHTHNAASSIARLKDMGVEPGLLATSLSCIVAQRLARRICTECREPYAPGAEELAQLGFEEAPRKDLVLYRAKGCDQCSNTGYSGRVGLYEIMEVRGRVRRLIEASTEEIFAAAVENGMTTLRQYAIQVVLDGTSSLEEIRRVTGDRLA
ncbi:MAG: ATPase, T2SS/T4P/T4SS family [Gaiellaceae bacterium]